MYRYRQTVSPDFGAAALLELDDLLGQCNKHQEEFGAVYSYPVLVLIVPEEI